MAKGQKIYSMTEAEVEKLMKKAAEAGAEAYRRENECSASQKVGRMLYKTKVLLEKYRYLKEYADKAVYTLEQAEDVDRSLADSEMLQRFGILDNDKTLHRMQRGVVTVKMIMAHVDRMLEAYREDCESSSSPVRQRQWRVIWNLYIAEERMTTKQSAEAEGEELRTIQNDAKIAREDLTALIFGIDGLLIRILKE